MIRRSAKTCALALILALGACDQGESAKSAQGIELVYGQAAVETVEVVIDPSDPSKAQVVARGYLADGCTGIDRVEVTPGRGNVLVSATIATARPAGFACIQVIKRFEERIAVDLAGRPDGDYVVEINGIGHPVRLDSASGRGTR